MQHANSKSQTTSFRLKSDAEAQLHQEPPEGVSRELHEVDLSLTAVSLRVHANLLWLGKDHLDVESARRTARQLVDSIGELEALVARLHLPPVHSESAGRNSARA